MKLKFQKPEIVIRNGRPSAVIIGIDEYEYMLEQLEQKKDIKALAVSRKQTVKFRPLQDFLAEFAPHA